MKIICIGRNYVDHAKEMNAPVPSEPVFFLKPDTAIIKDNQPFYYPDFSTDIQYEVELVLKINKPGKNIGTDFAYKYYSEIGIGIDFTARDIQNQCKEKGLPWEKAKGFDGAAPIGKFIAKEQIKDIKNINFSLKINNQLAQKGNSNDLLFSFDVLISYVSNFITLKTGDLIYTGTPAGVGSIKIGDKLSAFIENELLLDFEIK